MPRRSLLGGKLPPIDYAVCAFVAASIVFVATYSWMLFRSHGYIRTLDYDLGLWDQYTWGAANGYFDNTVRGLPLLGHHVSLGLFLFAPFYWFGAGPRFLDLAQILSLVAGAAGLCKLARHYGFGRIATAALPIGFLCNFSMSGALVVHFHPETMAVGPLVWGWYFAQRDQWRPAAAMLVLAIIWKEDVALTVVGLGLALLASRAPVDRRLRWREGGLVCLFATAWFVIATSVVVPAFSPNDDAFYGERIVLGDSAPEALTNAIGDPGLVADQLRRADGAGYAGKMTYAYGFVPFLSPSSLLIALPQAAVNLMVSPGYPYPWKPDSYYSVIPAAGLGIACVEGVRRLTGRRREVVALVALSGALLTGFLWGYSPWGERYRGNEYQLDSGFESRATAVAFVPAEAPVAATPGLTPQFTHRKLAYTFPNPWVPAYWAVRGEQPDDPYPIEWLVLDESMLSDDDLRLYLALVRSGGFEEVFSQDGIVVAKRVDLPDAPRDRLLWMPSFVGRSLADRARWAAERPYETLRFIDQFDPRCDAGNQYVHAQQDKNRLVRYRPGAEAELHFTFACR